jgi:putative Holliday junction resolvase
MIDDRSSMIPSHGRVLAADWGTSRIGLAVSDETQLIATPLGALKRRTGKRLPMRDFLDVVERESPVGLVVGLPLDDDGHEGDSAIAAREMAELFASKSGLPLDFTDEDFSTARVLEISREVGASARDRRHEVDARAAAVLLQQWLEERRGRTPR